MGDSDAVLPLRERIATFMDKEFGFLHEEFEFTQSVADFILQMVTERSEDASGLPMSEPTNATPVPLDKGGPIAQICAWTDAGISIAGEFVGLARAFEAKSLCKRINARLAHLLDVVVTDEVIAVAVASFNTVLDDGHDHDFDAAHPYAAAHALIAALRSLGVTVTPNTQYSSVAPCDGPRKCVKCDPDGAADAARERLAALDNATNKTSDE